MNPSKFLASTIKNVIGQQIRFSAGMAATLPRTSGVYSTVGMNNESPSLVIFDKDGTLLCFHTMWIPWAQYASQSIENATGMKLYQDVAKVLGLCTIENKVKPGLLAEGTMGQITTEIADILIRKGIPSFEARMMASDSLKYSNEMTITSQLVKEIYDTVALFTRLKQHGTKIAVCTADNRKSSMEALKRMNVLHLVDMVVCGDDKNSRPKPDAHNALRICDHLNVHPSEAIMVGDTRVDIEMAHAARLGSAVGVLSGVGCKDHLHRADVLLNNIGDIIEVFYEK
ncbi:unnamed protein product [Caenorhabditis angaria]|uniref:Uncharacterized protein n=1 Tax=Caenorhabditis angaria TaxID=860376 RepID=A0A9P1J376_9PELO|nr:unnamed protein product [Caenorhabditis angaria]